MYRFAIYIHVHFLDGRFPGGWKKLKKKVTVFENVHQCLRCQKWVLHELTFLKQHFGDGSCSTGSSPTKTTTLRDYFEGWILPVKVVKPENSSPSSSESASSSEDKSSSSVKSDYLSWSNQCVWMCVICNKTFGKSGSYGTLKNHLRFSHQTTLSETKKMEEGRGDPLVKGAWTECKVCGKGLLQDYDFLRSHVRAHRMTLMKYYTELVLPDRQSESNRSNTSLNQFRVGRKGRPPVYVRNAIIKVREKILSLLGQLLHFSHHFNCHLLLF